MTNNLKILVVVLSLFFFNTSKSSQLRHKEKFATPTSSQSEFIRCITLDSAHAVYTAMREKLNVHDMAIDFVSFFSHELRSKPNYRQQKELYESIIEDMKNDESYQSGLTPLQFCVRCEKFKSLTELICSYSLDPDKTFHPKQPLPLVNIVNKRSVDSLVALQYLLAYGAKVNDRTLYPEIYVHSFELGQSDKIVELLFKKQIVGLISIFDGIVVNSDVDFSYKELHVISAYGKLITACKHDKTERRQNIQNQLHISSDFLHELELLNESLNAQLANKSSVYKPYRYKTKYKPTSSSLPVQSLSQESNANMQPWSSNNVVARPAPNNRPSSSLHNTPSHSPSNAPSSSSYANYNQTAPAGFSAQSKNNATSSSSNQRQPESAQTKSDALEIAKEILRMNNHLGKELNMHNSEWRQKYDRASLYSCLNTDYATYWEQMFQAEARYNLFHTLLMSIGTERPDVDAAMKQIKSDKVLYKSLVNEGDQRYGRTSASQATVSFVEKVTGKKISTAKISEQLEVGKQRAKEKQLAKENERHNRRVQAANSRHREYNVSIAEETKPVDDSWVKELYAPSHPIEPSPSDYLVPKSTGWGKAD